MNTTFSKEQRLEYYKQALEHYQKDIANDECVEGICITLGRLSYGSYLAAPWIGWHTCCKYFHELEGTGYPFDEDHGQKGAKLRIESLTQAIAKASL